MKINRINLEKMPLFLKDFIFYLEVIAGKSDNTIYEYYLDIRSFLRFLSMKKKYVAKYNSFEEIDILNFQTMHLKDVTLSDVYDYMHFLSKERSNENVTRARKISALRTFYKYLSTKTNLGITNPLENLEVPSIKKSLPKHLSLEESLELLDVIDGQYKERDYCIITLFLNCGMRLSELVNININDISKNTVKVLGKGNKERIIYLNDACISAINQYIDMPQQKNLKDKSALFISKQGRRITNRRVQQIVDENLALADLDGKGYSTHKLRHTAATLMFQYGNVDIRILKEILGHENISTTEIYTHVSSTQMEQASHKSPLANIKRKD